MFASSNPVNWRLSNGANSDLVRIACTVMFATDWFNEPFLDGKSLFELTVERTLFEGQLAWQAAKIAMESPHWDPSRFIKYVALEFNNRDAVDRACVTPIGSILASKYRMTIKSIALHPKASDRVVADCLLLSAKNRFEFSLSDYLDELEQSADEDPVNRAIGPLTIEFVCDTMMCDVCACSFIVRRVSNSDRSDAYEFERRLWRAMKGRANSYVGHRCRERKDENMHTITTWIRRALATWLIDVCIGLCELDLPVLVMSKLFEALVPGQVYLLASAVWELAKSVKHAVVYNENE